MNRHLHHLERAVEPKHRLVAFDAVINAVLNGLSTRVEMRCVFAAFEPAIFPEKFKRDAVLNYCFVHGKTFNVRNVDQMGERPIERMPDNLAATSSRSSQFLPREFNADGRGFVLNHRGSCGEPSSTTDGHR